MSARVMRFGALSAAALGLLGAAWAWPASAALEPGEPANYTAVGDSFAAGTGYAPLSDFDCGRYENNPSTQAAAALGLRLDDRTCGATSIEDGFLAPGSGKEPQIEGITADTRYVTFGFGGNDVISLNIVGCAIIREGSDSPEGTPCKDGTDVGRLPEMNIEAFKTTLAKGLGEIKERAPQAKVIVVGYPAVFPADAGQCVFGEPKQAGAFTRGDMEWYHGKFAELNEALRAGAEQHGYAYADTYRATEGHDVCASVEDRDVRWIGGIKWDQDEADNLGGSLHPNLRGQVEIGKVLAAALEQAGA